MKSRKHLYLIIVVLIVPCVVGQMSGDDDDGDDLAIDLSAYGTRLYGTPQKSAGEMLKKWQLSQENSAENSHVLVNPEEIGPYVEGDILIPRSTATSSDGRNGMVAESYRWHDGIIPIELIGPFDTRAMKLIEEAIQSYHDNTCLKFMPRRRTDLDYISIQSGSTGCWSSVGRIGGRQVVNLQSPGCTTKVGTVIHELMHASGFLHEQNREERDEFVDIRFENVRKGYENNFEKASPGLASGFGVDYDYGSVMHYSTGAFTVNGQPTIVTKVR